MIEVKIVLFNRENREFDFWSDLSLAAVPSIGCKLVLMTGLDNKPELHMIHDVHYAKEGIFIYAYYINSVQSFANSGHPQIPY